MVWSLISQVVRLVIDLLMLHKTADEDKALELLVLRQQIRILERRLGKPVRPSRVEKLLLTVTAVQLKAREGRQRFTDSILLFKPATVLKWHSELVKHKWTFQRHAKIGRPRIEAEIESLIVRLAQENPGLGFEKIQGELLKLGYDVSVSTVRAVFARHHIPTVPERDRARSNWRTFLNHYRTQMLACDFFTIETVFLKTVYVLFFIDVGTRQVYLAGCTQHPDSAWITQQARQLTWQLQQQDSHTRFLIHDRDTKFTAPFDTVFSSEGVEVVLTPYQAPNANAFAERWIRTVRHECLDQLLILNEAHLHRILIEYIDYYNHSRPHQGLQQQAPIPFKLQSHQGPVYRREVLGGIIHDYWRQAS